MYNEQRLTQIHKPNDAMMLTRKQILTRAQALLLVYFLITLIQFMYI